MIVYRTVNCVSRLTDKGIIDYAKSIKENFMKTNKRSLALLLIACMLAALLAGCSGSSEAAEGTQAPESESSAQTAQAADQTAETAQAASSVTFAGSENAKLTFSNEYTLPLSDTKETLTMMRAAVNLMGDLANIGISTFNDFKYLQDLEEKTNVHIEFTEVDYFSKDEKMALAIASGDYADMMVDLNYAGGDTKAYSDGVIVDLSDKLEEYAPNYNNMLNSNESYKNSFLSEGKALCFKTPYEDYKNNQGMVVRKDWLDKAGLEVPETYDQLHDVLAAFKSEYNCATAIYMNKNCQITGLSTGYNVGTFAAGGTATKLPYFVDNGTVKCSLIDDEYLSYLKMMNTWYNDGLFDPDFISLEDDPFSNYLSEQISSNQMGVWNTSTEGIDNYAPLFDESDNFAITPISNPVQNAGDMDHITEISLVPDTINTYITANCDNLELAMKWVDYWYSTDGILLYNYGLENETYTLTDGSPAFTDVVLNNEYNLTPSNYMRCACAYGVFSGVMLRYRTAEYNTELAQQAWDAWTNSVDGSMTLPSYISLSEDETSEVSSATSDILTYAQEKVPQFITGEVSFDQWDAYVNDLKGMGIDSCINVEQQVYDRSVS